MHTEIFFGDKILILTNTPSGVEDACRMPSSYLSIANVLKFFETANIVEVCDSAIEAVAEQFYSEFKYVEAAGGLVCNEQNETLMIYCYKHWDLPKGHVDAGESDAETAVREVGEETGVKNAKIVRFLCNTLHTYNVYGSWELKRTAWFELRANKCETKPQAEEDILSAKWCSAEEVEQNLHATYPSIRRVFAVKNR